MFEVVRKNRSVKENSNLKKDKKDINFLFFYSVDVFSEAKVSGVFFSKKLKFD